MAPGSAGTQEEKDKYKNAKDAKHLLDMIGETVQKKVHGAAKNYIDDLKGSLSKARYPNDKSPEGSTENNPCKLQYDYNTNVTDGYEKEYPCKDRPEVRFSDTEGAQCDKSKIKDNKGKSEGACAPYRRSSLCDHHLSYMNADKTNTTDNLLLEVCMAALHEGDSLKHYSEKLNLTYSDSRSQLCTELARSFADIGDIVRGRDLYGGNKKEKEKREDLENKLKKIFENIKKSDTKLTNLNDDQIREYWWEANRKEVWKAITCGHPGGKYFRATCGGDGKHSTQASQCRCKGDQVPTYFDYVPQYLRWFEEWAEDFCRKRKKKLENAIQKCRKPNGKEKYCDLNGYNCERTKYKIGYFVEGADCKKCSVACTNFVPWIKNQKQEFEKQKGKYTKEMEKYTNGESGSRRLRRGASTTNYNGYEKKFYKVLQSNGYETVDDFLEKLSNEEICTKVKDDKGGKIDFKTVDVGKNGDSVASDSNNSNKTFAPTEYCDPCPLCGVDCKKSTCTRNPDESCKEETTEKVYPESNTTKIPKLTAEKRKRGILKKYEKFCQNPKEHEQIKNWECHYEKKNEEDENDASGDSNNCILGDWKTSENVHYPISYYSFFYGSIIDMLNDSIEWRAQLNSCINNGKKDCISKCNSRCDCYKRWVEKKQTEWGKIKDHFGKQEDLLKDMKKGFFPDTDPGDFLEYYLEINFLQDMKDAKGDPKVIEKFKEILGKENEDDLPNFLNEKRIIEEFLEKELRDAKKCLTTHTKDDCPKVESPLRSENFEDPARRRRRRRRRRRGVVNTPKEEEEETAKKAADTTTPQIDVCPIVAGVLTKENLQAACSTKYEKGREKFPNWKCIPSGDKTGTSENGDAKSRVARSADGATGKSDATSGSICVPPRRRRLYVKKIHDWATKTESQTQESNEATQARDKATEALRDAFVESAAIETFFLWHQYKTENKPQGVGVGPLLQLQPPGLTGDSNDPDPQNQLASGTIPPDFLRQMFYTLGDYRDILFGDTTMINTVSRASGDKDTMKKIQEKIQQILSQNGEKPSKPSVTTPQQTLWDEIAEHIWNGMIYALTYKTDTQSGQTPEQNDTVKTKLWDKTTKKPKDEYQYQTAKLKEEASGEKTPLSKFVVRPPYFRYLEEWGQNFCKERKKRLAQIKHECMDDDKQKYSGDGEECTQMLRDDPTTLPDLGSSCPKSCRSYKKWIQRKKTQYEKQKEIYNEQKTKCQTQSKDATSNNNDKGFCETLTKYNDAAAFLQTLGPCKNENGKDEIKFDKDSKTFKHTDYCGPCSQFRIKCENGKCKSGDTKVTCPGGKITTGNFESWVQQLQDVTMSVSDSNTNGNKFDGDLSDCHGAGIFKGIRKEQWKCRNVCGYVVCKSENVNGKQNENQIILINALLQRWVEYFLEDYSKIIAKISRCKENDEKNICIKACVEKWINIKKKEWETLKDRFIQQYKYERDEYFNVRSFLETFLVRIGAANVKTDQNKIIKLSNFDTPCGCSADASAQKRDGNDDAIDCMINKLTEKIKTGSCLTQPSGKETNCGENTTPQPDDEDLLLEEENTVEAPKICENVLKTPQPEETDGTCDPAPPPNEPEEEKKEDSVEPKSSEEDQSPEEKVPPSPAAPAAPAAPPAAPAPQPATPPKVEENPFDPTILQTTIPFGIALALGSIAFLFLKKKTKASVGNLFQILQIPKGDYDIPTKLSPNRYIPYTSGKYRGKRYIYLEGDSGTDSGYTDHYSDITSSSESEYEELDINDIYVPHAPKYKTLIEVVLEPSKRDTQNDIPSGDTIPTSDTPPPTSGNTIPTSDIPNTPSDTPSPITDEEWNTLKDEFISQYLQSEQNTEPNMLGYNVDNNTNPKTLHVSMEEKPFITSIHDRNLYSGEEYSYNVNMVNNDNIPINRDNNHVYSGIDLINDSLNSGNQPIDIYDEVLKRKENELFGTNHVKQTSIHSVAKPISDDPIHNQLELFHKWLDRHRDMCEKWENHHERLAKLKEEWENETHSGDINSGIPSGKLSDTPSDNNIHSDIHPSDIPSGKQSDIPSDNNIHSDIPYVLNTDVSIQIHMDNPKTTNEFTYVDSNPNQVDDTYVDSNPDNSSMDTILEDLDKYNEPYYDVQDDIYYDVHDHDASTVDTNAMDVPSKVQIEMDVNTKLVKEKYPIADVWDI
ncbi:hypothetical protein PFMG_01341 [Plasmodium falciparum IGH-CR14]|uniref:Erythrocyte membrane protein 1 n=1 Tax=Plasmodium falciparum IGH-CR14 TaxID=580059 RepID=A0A0L1I7L5_PLAFA|nr:hypothetical protein PFMG_01341 [Plasmodium falciparum IGH-CR14]